VAYLPLPIGMEVAYQPFLTDSETLYRCVNRTVIALINVRDPNILSSAFLVSVLLAGSICECLLDLIGDS